MSLPELVVVMGPAGCGKTTVGRLLASACGRPFLDADDFHAPEHIARMQAGQPLDDADRLPWLQRLREQLQQQRQAGQQPVLACSALKPAYRQALLPAGLTASDVTFIYLHVPAAELQRRLQQRRGHFAAEALLHSQLATLDLPHDEAGILTLDGTLSPQQLVQAIRQQWG